MKWLLLTLFLATQMATALALDYGGKITCSEDNRRSLGIRCLAEECDLVALEMMGQEGLEFRKTGRVLHSGYDIEKIKIIMGGGNIDDFNEATTLFGKVAIGWFGYPLSIARNMADFGTSKKVTRTVKKAMHFMLDRSNSGNELQVDCEGAIGTLFSFTSSIVEGVDTHLENKRVCLDGKEEGICTLDRVKGYHFKTISEYEVAELFDDRTILVRAIKENAKPGFYYKMAIRDLFLEKDSCIDSICLGDAVDFLYHGNITKVVALNVHTGRLVGSDGGEYPVYETAFKDYVYQREGCINGYCVGDEVVGKKVNLTYDITTIYVGRIISINKRSGHIMLEPTDHPGRLEVLFASHIFRKL